jgi:hypothetical protein
VLLVVVLSVTVILVLLIENNLHQNVHVHQVKKLSMDLVKLVIITVLNVLELSEIVLLVLLTELMPQPVTVHPVTIILKIKLTVHLVLNNVLNVLPKPFVLLVLKEELTHQNVSFHHQLLLLPEFPMFQSVLLKSLTVLPIVNLVITLLITV